MLARNRVPKTEGRTWIALEEVEATSADRAFLEAWRKRADDPVWSRTVAAVQAHFPRRGAARWIAMMALRTNRWADDAGFGVDSFFDLAREERQKLLELADKAEALAKYFRDLDEMTADHFYGFPLPVEGMANLHLKQSERLRALAGNEPKPTVPLSRQDRRGEHSGLRARRAFIQLIHKELTGLLEGESAVGFNFVEATTAFARIKFPDVDAEVVRKTLEPNTRESRRWWRANRKKPKPDHRAA